MSASSETDAGKPAGLIWRYDRAEILADGVVHAVGLTLGLVGAAALAVQAARILPTVEAASVWIYAAGLLAMLAFSAAYNLWPISPTKWVLRRFDHAGIYLLIAGTYTPFVAQMEWGPTAVLLCSGIWLTALVGIAVKLWLPGRLDRVSIGLYLLMSWSGAVAYRSVLDSVPALCLWLLLVGGLAYSFGVVFHVWHRLRFQNAIWHVFVLIGATTHYGAVAFILSHRDAAS